VGARAEGEALSRPAPWLPEALALDLAEHHVALSDARLDPSELAAFSMDLPAALDPAHRRVRVRWAVEGEAVVERPRTLLLHRHPTLGSVETLELSALGADLLDAMDDGATPVTAAIGGVLSRRGLSADGAFIGSLRRAARRPDGARGASRIAAGVTGPGTLPKHPGLATRRRPSPWRPPLR
jgi:hypothetical protein